MTRGQFQILDLVSNTTLWIDNGWWVLTLVRHVLVKHTRPWWTLNAIIVFWRPLVRPTVTMGLTLGVISALLDHTVPQWGKVLLCLAYYWFWRIWWHKVSRWYEDEDDDLPKKKLKAWIKKRTTIKVLKPATIGR